MVRISLLVGALAATVIVAAAPIPERQSGYMGPDNATRSVSNRSDQLQSRGRPQSEGKRLRRATAQIDLEHELTRRQFEAWLLARAPKGAGGKPRTTEHASPKSAGPAEKSPEGHSPEGRSPQEQGAQAQGAEGQAPEGQASGSNFGSNLLDTFSSMNPLLGGLLGGGNSGSGGSGGSGSSGGNGSSGSSALGFGSDTNSNSVSTADQSNHHVSAGVVNAPTFS